MKKCDCCKKELTKKDFPYLYKCIGNLCSKCKKLANYILSKRK